MAILCRVELSQARGKLRGLKIIHPDMGLVMDWGSTLEDASVRLVPQEVAFQMMADVERVKTQRMARKQAETAGEATAENEVDVEQQPVIIGLPGFFAPRETSSRRHSVG